MSDQKLYILVEDDGLEAFLKSTIDLTPLRLVPLEVRSCGGWQGVFAQYEELVLDGCDPARILPVLDADEIGATLPATRSVLSNVNLTRFPQDLEAAFDDWMLAEVLLQCSPFPQGRTPEHYLACYNLVRDARRRSLRGEFKLYQGLQRCGGEEYARQGHDATAFVLPGKKQLALMLADVTRAACQFSSHLQEVIDRACRIAAELGYPIPSPAARTASHSLNSDGIRAFQLKGEVLLSLSATPYPELWLIDFDAFSFRKYGSGTFSMGYASWSKDGAAFAGMSPRSAAPASPKASVLVVSGDGKQSWVSRNLTRGSEGHPCWFPDGSSLLLRTEAGTYKASIDFARDHTRWRELYKAQTAYHCVSHRGLIARTTYRDGVYVLEILLRDAVDAELTVPSTTDVRGAVSWSPSGRYLAFANQMPNESGAVCVYDRRQRETRCITTHHARPYFVAFSPDERFVLFTSQDTNERRSLRVVELRSGQVQVVLEPANRDIIIGCHSWRSGKSARENTNEEAR